MTVVRKYNSKHVTLYYVTTDKDNEKIYIPTRKYLYLLGEKKAFEENEFYIIENDVTKIRIFFAHKQLILDPQSSYVFTYKRLTANKFDLLLVLSDERFDIEPYISIESINVNLADLESINSTIRDTLNDFYSDFQKTLAEPIEGYKFVGTHEYTDYKSLSQSINADAGVEGSAEVSINIHNRGQVKLFVRLDNKADYIRVFIKETADGIEYLYDEVTDSDKMLCIIPIWGYVTFVVRIYSSSSALSGLVRLYYDYKI